MKTSTIYYIDKPSDRLLENLRNLLKAKEENKKQMRSDWTKYFQEND